MSTENPYQPPGSTADLAAPAKPTLPATSKWHASLGLSLLFFVLMIPPGYFEQAQIRAELLAGAAPLADDTALWVNLGLFGAALVLGLVLPSQVWFAIAGRFVGGLAFYYSSAFAPEGEQFLVMWILLIWLAVKDALPCLTGAFCAFLWRQRGSAN